MTQTRSAVRTRTKQCLRFGLIAPLVLLGVSGLFLTSVVFSAVARSEQTEEIFTDAAELPPELIDEVEWLPDSPDLPRDVEPLTRVDVTASWLRAWEQLTIVGRTGDRSGVESYFAGSALTGVLARSGEWGDQSVKQLGHVLEVTFYSEDGQIMGLTAVESRLQRSDRTDAGELVQDSVESYDAVLVLDDGNWRIHHLVRRSYEAGAWVLLDS